MGLIAADMVHARQLERFEPQSEISVPLLDRDFFSGHAGMVHAGPGSAPVGLVRLKGGFTVASSRQLLDVIGADIKGHDVVIFDFSGTAYLDGSAAKLIGDLLDITGEQRTAFIFAGLSDVAAQTLFAFGVLRRGSEGYLEETMEQARDVAHGFLAEAEEG